MFIGFGEVPWNLAWLMGFSLNYANSDSSLFTDFVVTAL
jgi:hypothetical protein